MTGIPKIRYHFGRLNLLATFDNKAEFLREQLTRWNRVPSGQHQWGLLEVESLTIDEDSGHYLTGFLVKLRPETEQEVANLTEHTLATTQVANRIAAKSRWFLHIRTGLIAYHRVSSHIDDGQFRTYFARILMESRQQFFIDAEIQTVQERYEFFETLARFQSVRFLRFQLHPTNPSFDREYREIDERLKRLEAERYVEELHAKTGGGLSIDDDPKIRGSATMAEDGYGTATVKGTLDGEDRTIKTGTHPIEHPVPATLDKVADVLRELSGAFRRIMERVNRD